MKKAIMTFSAVLLSIAAIARGGNEILNDFRNPGRNARPYLWWHWMDGEVSLDGIQKDLQWMNEVGIGGIHQFDAGGVNMPKAAPFKRPYLSDQWKEAFRYAVNTAHSLGMEMAIASAPGWSSTGGPWVQAEDAMKKLEWQSVTVNGGTVDMMLPELAKITGPYRDVEAKPAHVTVNPYGCDVAVVAVKLPEDDGIVRAVTIRTSETGSRPRTGEGPCSGILECSNDGKKWKTVKKIHRSNMEYQTINVPPTKARYFRVRGSGVKSYQLHTENKVEQAEEKAAFCLIYDFAKWTTDIKQKPRFAIETIDLTDKMTPDGHLKCTLPAGRWRIYRFGASLTGKMNHPASPNATGLEVDKLDKDAWRRYFRKYLEMYRDAAGGMLGANGITHILIDSYEAGTQTWTKNLPQEFYSRRGYDLIPKLPILAGEIVGSPEESEKFLFDWRKTLAELFEENYNSVNDIIAEFGMKGSYIESHESGRAFTSDGMHVKKNATVPMSAIWMTDSKFGGSLFASAVSDIRESASVAHIYGQNIAAAESFTVNGDGGAAYTYHPGNIKMIADAALASGLNRFVIHEGASQPSDDYLPGLGLFKYGQWFHRNETWAPYARVWTDYLARSSSMMQEGQFVADILVFYGEDSNATAVYGGEYLHYLAQIPAGYNYDYASPDVLLNAVTAQDGRLNTKSGQQYKVLAIGRGARIVSPRMKARIDEFRRSGVIVCDEEELGKTLKNAGIEPDVAMEGIGADNLMYGLEGAAKRNTRGHDCSLPGVQFVHRKTDGADIYWLCNFTDESIKTTARFRSCRKYAAMLNPEDGCAEKVAYDKGSVNVDLKPGDAIFYLLTDNGLDIPAQMPERKEKEIQTLTGWWDVEFCQKGGESARETFSVLNDWTTNSDPVVKYFSGTANYKSTFTVARGALSNLQEAVMDLGEVNVMAQLIINGHDAGVLWRKPYVSKNILPFIREGENTVEVNVTNLWVNRMIGDRQRNAKPVTQVRRFYEAQDALMPSGMLGPVILKGIFN